MFLRRGSRFVKGLSCAFGVSGQAEEKSRVTGNVLTMGGLTGVKGRPGGTAQTGWGTVLLSYIKETGLCRAFRHNPVIGGEKSVLIFLLGRIEVEYLFVAALVEILLAQRVGMFGRVVSPIIGHVDGKVESLSERLFRGFVLAGDVVGCSVGG